jgi:hypothetical protein
MAVRGEFAEYVEVPVGHRVFAFLTTPVGFLCPCPGIRMPEPWQVMVERSEIWCIIKPFKILL